jgi:replication factor C subunit 3/5
MPKIDDSLKSDIVKWSAFYEHRIRNGSVHLRIPDRQLHNY